MSVIKQYSLDDGYELFTCQKCGETLPESDVNVIDYDIDLCVKCENEILKRSQAKKDLFRRKDLVVGKLLYDLSNYDFEFISYDLSEGKLYFNGAKKDNSEKYLFRVDKDDCVYVKEPVSETYVKVLKLSF